VAIGESVDLCKTIDAYAKVGVSEWELGKSYFHSVGPSVRDKLLKLKSQGAF
jgi:hypothetical protein